MKRIICLGNRYVSEDAAGPRVYDRLRQGPLPEDVAVIDGGLAGLDLARFVEGTERVVFVDAFRGMAGPNSVAVLSAAEVADLAGSRYEHAAGLPYLLRVLPDICDGPLPEVVVVGIEGSPSEPLIEDAASAALRIAVEGVTIPGSSSLFHRGSARIYADIKIESL